MLKSLLYKLLVKPARDAALKRAVDELRQLTKAEFEEELRRHSDGEIARAFRELRSEEAWEEFNNELILASTSPISVDHLGPIYSANSDKRSADFFWQPFARTFVCEYASGDAISNFFGLKARDYLVPTSRISEISTASQSTGSLEITDRTIGSHRQFSISNPEAGEWPEAA